jgi:hypothetical protein
MTWSDFVHGDAAASGTEGGEIIADQEHDLGARITLERGAAVAPFAITCGVDGWMVHTRFFGTEADARQQFAAMQESLDAIVARTAAYDDTPSDSQIAEASQVFEDFVGRFP